MDFFYYFVILVTLVAGITYLFFKHIRYGSSREFFLNIFCYVQGRRVVWIRDPAVVHLVLQSSPTKGSGLEHLLSCQAFLPIISLESVSGDVWIRMKRNFVKLRSHLPPLSKLAKDTVSVTTMYLEKNNVIDSPTLAQMVLHCFFQWLFDTDPRKDPTELKMFLTAVEEWRKELAVKSKGDMRIKLKAVEWMKSIIRQSKYFEVFGEKWEEPEYWSLIVQPFFLSPIINITDIAVTLSSQPMNNLYHKGGGVWSEQLLLTAINAAHPFPVVERWFPDGLSVHTSEDKIPESVKFVIPSNTHVFIPMDEVGASLISTDVPKWSAFGAGKRVCAGQDLALVICAEMFKPLILHEKFQPARGHHFSGRDNDNKETVLQSLFQIFVIFRTLWMILVVGIRNEEADNFQQSIMDTAADVDSINKNKNRMRMYGIGGIRLLFLLVCLSPLLGFGHGEIFTVSTLCYAIFGIAGASLNLHILSTPCQLFTLLLLVTSFLVNYAWSESTEKVVLVLYVLKTIFGDEIAGKLDGRKWLRSLFILVVLLGVVSSAIIPILPHVSHLVLLLTEDARVFVFHLFCHWLCELGNGPIENLRFLRYNYEISLIFLSLIDWSVTNRYLIIMDLVASLAYRFTNYIYVIAVLK